ncbi:VOC family protein [Aestuariimicrobium soli]|uniref:VOC family protein n=1 Tax=Aestuariimicrobium soli TaxID=2035834 RepID=UPI003EB76D11
MSTPITQLMAFTIDTPDAAKSATFYAELTGGEVTGNYPEYGVASAAVFGQTFNFQGVADYTRPEWPDQAHPQQFHLDFRVDDLDAAVAHATSLGATEAEHQPAAELGGSWRVMLDPDGHPFCLCPPS